MAAFDRATAPGNLDLGSSLSSTLGQPGCHGNSRSRWPIVNVVRMSNLILVCRCARYIPLYYVILRRQDEQPYSCQSVAYRYREFPVPGIFHFFLWYRNRYRKKMVPEKSLGTGIGKIWYRKKVSEPVSEKFGTRKSLGTETFIFVAKI